MEKVTIAEIMNSMAANLADALDIKQLQKVKLALYMALENCDIIKLENELSTDVDCNVDLMKAYAVDMTLRGCTESSIKAYMYGIKSFEAIVNKSFLRITPADMMNYMGHGKIKLKWKDTTYNTKLRMLRKFYDFLVENDYMDRNPCRKLKETKVEHVMGQTINSVQREQIRCACGTERDLAIMDMLYSSGIRVSELCGLNRSDIDMESMSGKVYGKGRKERMIYFSGAAKTHITNYLKERTDSNEALFVGKHKPFNRMTKGGVEVMLKELVKKNGIENVRLTPHVLRRSIGTDMINRGAPLELVADKLGHANMDTTRQCYARYSQESVRYGNQKYAEI